MAPLSEPAFDAAHRRAHRQEYTDEESRIVRFVPRETSPHRYPASFPPGRKVGASRSDSFEAGP
jgi:hypothetical protein